MAIKSGRVGVRHDQVDHYGRIRNVAGGIYSNLSAGSLVSSSSADSSKVNTPSSFTGKIDLTSIKGNTIKWNQLVPTKMSHDFEAGISNQNWYVGQIVNIVSGHKYVYILTQKQTLTSNTRNTAEIQYVDTSSASVTVNQTSESNANLNAGKRGWFFTAPTDNKNNWIGLYYWCHTPNIAVTIENPMLLDLTQMFGAGNEPTTLEQFESMFPLDWYEYDTGSLLFFNATSLQNTFTGEEIYLPTLKYFPNGMKSAGNAYDELTPSKAVTRIGVVDLGSLAWDMPSSGLFQALINDLKTPTNNLLCKYATENYSTTSANMPDKSIKSYGTSASKYVYVKDSAYSTVESFKSAMSGVYLYYELAAPIENDIDVDFNLSLNVNEGENLQLFPLGTDTPASAPLRATVTSYKSGATGNDVEKLLGSIAQVETSPATTNHAEGDYIMYNYQLYKVTASITTGASLVVGTNITATTVMDEFKTL